MIKFLDKDNLIFSIIEDQATLNEKKEVMCNSITFSDAAITKKSALRNFYKSELFKLEEQEKKIKGNFETEYKKFLELHKEDTEMCEK